VDSLFLDEPTSGLDSQTSWAIIDLLDKLKKNGQAICKCLIVHL
jgi:ABC-type multidrug transport system ATPase subunit